MKVSDLRIEAPKLLQAKNRDLASLISKFATQSKIPVGTCKVWKSTAGKKEKKDEKQANFDRTDCGANLPSSRQWESCPDSRGVRLSACRSAHGRHAQGRALGLFPGSSKQPLMLCWRKLLNVFTHKLRMLCTFSYFFFPCIFINERKMLSDSPLKGCKSSDQLSPLSCMCHVVLLTRVISTLQDIGVTHGRALCQQGSLSKCLWKYFRVQRGNKIRR